MANLLDLRCPSCGADHSIDILASVWVRVTERGTDPDGSSDGTHEFTPASRAECIACNHGGTVADFTPDEVA